MKLVLGQEKVHLNTAFVAINSTLISKITDYRDDQEENPYKNIVNKLVDLSDLKRDRGKTIETELVAPKQKGNVILFNHLDSASEKVVYNKAHFAPIITENMANVLIELNSYKKLKHVSPVKSRVYRERQTSSELHLASAFKKKFKLNNENGNELDNNNGDEAMEVF